MRSHDKIWNGRLAGLPGALVLAIGVVLKQIGDRLVSALWSQNLGFCGKGTQIQRGVTIRHPGRIRIAAGTTVATGVELSSELSGSLCEIGSDCIIGRRARLDFSGGLVLEDGVVVSEDAKVYTHDHRLDPKSIPAKSPLVIGAGAWIGSGAMIVEGAGRIGTGSVIAAGSIVTREVPDHALVAGVPARVIRMLNPEK
ncbi:acyltransferase [Roseovarius sp. CH_XMU1461]|uniref:acyltransferase n=1 Tax=Roseovarius sp. CH_XMU1461 TaxID=3107777 RepID=UPI0030098B3D